MICGIQQAIPQFLPILRGSLHSPIICDADVGEKLDHRAVNRLASRYQEHLRQCAEVVSAEQSVLATRIREVACAFSSYSYLSFIIGACLLEQFTRVVI